MGNRPIADDLRAGLRLPEGWTWIDAPGPATGVGPTAAGFTPSLVLTDEPRFPDDARRWIEQTARTLEGALADYRMIDAEDGSSPDSDGVHLVGLHRTGGRGVWLEQWLHRRGTHAVVLSFTTLTDHALVDRPAVLPSVRSWMEVGA